MKHNLAGFRFIDDASGSRAVPALPSPMERVDWGKVKLVKAIGAYLVWLYPRILINKSVMINIFFKLNSFLKINSVENLFEIYRWGITNK